MSPYPGAKDPAALPARLRALARRAWLLLVDPGRYSAERYAASSKMHLSAVRPETWRRDLGPDAQRLAEPRARQ